jgi:hypothetical protein
MEMPTRKEGVQEGRGGSGMEESDNLVGQHHLENNVQWSRKGGEGANWPNCIDD